MFPKFFSFTCCLPAVTLLAFYFCLRTRSMNIDLGWINPVRCFNSYSNLCLFLLCLDFTWTTFLLERSKEQNLWGEISLPSRCLCMQQYGTGLVGLPMEANIELITNTPLMSLNSPTLFCTVVLSIQSSSSQNVITQRVLKRFPPGSHLREELRWRASGPSL